MSINSELTRLDAVRDALVASVNSKGGELPDEATLWQVKQAVDGIETGPAEDPLPVVTQPAPAVSLNSSSGLVTAKYTPVAGKVEDTAEKSGTLQLTTQAAQTITPGTSNKTIASGRYLTGTQTIKGDSNLTAGNIKKGVSIFGVSGSFEAAAEPVIPSTCLAYLSGNGKLYVKQGSGMTAAGLTKQTTTDRAGWDAYSGFSAGTFAGSVLSKDGVYLQWDGFSDFTAKYTIHSLLGATTVSSEVYLWGFNTQEWGYEGDYQISDLPLYWYTAGEGNGGAGVRFTDGWHNVENLKAGFFVASFTWDGPGNVAVNLITARSDRYKRTLLYPYDDMMGFGEKYTVGNKLYLGKPPAMNGSSGAIIGGFAIDLNPAGYTDGTNYICPLLDGTYKNL